MAATHDLINPSDSNINAFGGSAVTATARAVTPAATLTDAQVIVGVVANNAAAMKASSTAAQQAQIAGVLIDTIIADVDLSTAVKRKAFRLKKGLDELEQIVAQIGA